MSKLRQSAERNEATEHQTATARAICSSQGTFAFSSETPLTDPTKRFEHTKSTSSKIETKVSFPVKLDVHPYTTAHKAAIKAAKASPSGTVQSNHNVNSPTNSLVYELSSVIVHKGKIDSGHYVSYSREGNDWFMFDDSKVVLVSEAEVLAAEAYLLFYMVSGLEV